jgi:hypothetical protein
VRTSRPPSHAPGTPAPGVPQRTATLPTAPAPKPMESTDPSLLGKIERAAISQLAITLPSTVIDEREPIMALPMLDFRERLMRGKLPQQVTDDAWRYLAALAREQRGDWNLFALGVAYPKLRKQASRVTDRLTGAPRDDMHQSIAAEFVIALHRLELDRPYVFNRLVDAAYTHASGRKRRPREWLTDIETLDAVQPRTELRDGPEAQAEINENSQISERDVLAAVIVQVNTAPGRERITTVQAELISRTYLDGERLRDVGADFNLSEPSASKQRRRAANLIARALGRPDLADPPRPRTSGDAPASQTAPSRATV